MSKRGDPNRVKNPDAVTLGRLGGKKGGQARAASMTAAQRSEVARKASNARWAKAREARAAAALTPEAWGDMFEGLADPLTQFVQRGMAAQRAVNDILDRKTPSTDPAK